MLGGHLDDLVFRFAASKNEEECWMDEEERRDARKKKENKMVKLEYEKFEFHVDIFPCQMPPHTNQDLET